MVVARPAAWILDLELDTIGTHAEVSFFDGPDPFPEPLPWESPERRPDRRSAPTPCTP